MDREAWQVTVLRTAKSWMGLKRLSRQTDGKFSYLGLPRWLSGNESTCQCRRLKTPSWSLGWEYTLEAGMTIHSSIPAWKIPWTEEIGGLQSMGSQRVRHDWATKSAAQGRAESAFLVDSQVLQLLLVYRPHFRNHCSDFRWFKRKQGEGNGEGQDWGPSPTSFSWTRTLCFRHPALGWDFLWVKFSAPKVVGKTLL